MTTRAALRKGWCPGARRPMESGDGLLLRVRPRAGVFSLPALLAIARAAHAFGSAEIDLTNRGNLQLRGLDAEVYPEAIALLEAAGLIDEDGASEAVRNVVVDPLSGIDPARADIRVHASRLEAALVADQILRGLPAKFGFSFSGSIEPSVGGRTADVMISALDSDTLAVWLDGEAEVAALVPVERVIEAVIRLAATFVELCRDDPSIRRMKDAVARRGSAAVYALTGLTAQKIPQDATAVAAPPPVGLLKFEARIFAAGVRLPFGRILAGELEALCAVGFRSCVEAVHTGPQRVLIFPVNGEEEALAVLSQADHLGLITALDDPRTRLDVCPGSPACRNASTATRRDAQHLVDVLQGKLLAIPSLHISGCEKGCARSAPAAWTLVARDGFYDVVRDGGAAGPVVLAGVAPSEIGAAISALIGGPGR